jgi:hypothetical protein
MGDEIQLKAAIKRYKIAEANGWDEKRREAWEEIKKLTKVDCRQKHGRWKK